MTSNNVHTLVHIGAGSQLPDYQHLQPQRLILIEPLPAQAEELCRLAADMANTEVWELAVSCEGNNQGSRFTEYNLVDYSSLHPAEGLATLYPGIKAIREHQVATLTPASLMEQVQLPDNEQHWLVVEANGEETAIIQALLQQQQLQQFSRVQISLPTHQLYQGAYNPEQLASELRSQSFELVQNNTDDPDISVLVWQLNPLKIKIDNLNQCITELEQKLAESQTTCSAQQSRLAEQDNLAKKQQEKLAQAQQQNKNLEEQVNSLTSTHTECTTKIAQQEQQLAESQASNTKLKKQLADALAQQELQAKQRQQYQQELAAVQEQLNTSQEDLAKYKNYFANRKQQHEAAEKRIEELNQSLAENTAQLATVREQLQNQQHSASKFNQLEQKMEQLFANQAEQMLQNTNALGQHVTKMQTNSNRQWQATLAVQHSLHHGELPLQYGDASISPELAQQLVSLVQRNNYDLIIEFGSGTSTLLLAQALLSRTRLWQQNTRAIAHKNKGSNQELPSEQDLPKRIISFEHNKQYYRQTQQDIQQQGLSEVVDLVLSPLVDYPDPAQPSLFYDCRTRLEQLATIFSGQEKHILVLVDGPSASHEQVSRYPALPLLLNHLAAHRLDVILDDYHRPDEQNSAEQWRQQLTQRSLDFSEREWAGDKSALFISINA
ncbi:hypothetical protein [Zobellella iuensis]|uniref:Chromosome partition protein Smc n=1 Tax=Zobellella iuensis TaxID=2803811 RepID=A0ABS1QSA3_9GAMM|nr:hypothetical protein [Zobellella iuensis]MBL1377754.1 hypothetical protein [Zobellella iuensis]